MTIIFHGVELLPPDEGDEWKVQPGEKVINCITEAHVYYNASKEDVPPVHFIVLRQQYAGCKRQEIWLSPQELEDIYAQYKQDIDKKECIATVDEELSELSDWETDLEEW